jgi:hypothetical protein
MEITWSDQDINSKDARTTIVYVGKTSKLQGEGALPSTLFAWPVVACINLVLGWL